MRKIRITESQWKTIMESELGYPLDLSSGPVEPDNVAGDEVASDPIAFDVETDGENGIATIPDAIKQAKRTSIYNQRTSRTHGPFSIGESRELDNAQNSGYGVKYDSQINAIAKDGGKMVVNIAREVNSNKRGSRNNTNQVRISRMEDDKKNDPANFAKNGGEQTLKILKSQVKKTSDTAKAKKNNTVSANRTATPATTEKKKKKNNNGVYYFA